MKSKINIPVGVALFVALALLALSAVVTLPQLSPSLVFGQAMPLQPPTGLTAVTTSQTNIVLVWTPAGNGGGYMVERSEDGSTGWEEVSTTRPAVTATTYSDTDESLELRTTYYYRVSTVDATPDTRRSRPSNVANATTSGPDRPGAPDLLAVDDGGVVAQGPSRIDLKWTAPGEDATGGGDITGYKIEYSDSSEAVAADVAANSWRVLVANLNKTKDEDADTPGTQITYTDGSVANLDVDDQRWYRVSAINSAGAGMPSEAIRSGAIPEEAQVATSAPTGLTARAMGPTQINLSWTAPTDTSGDEITGYQIEYSVLDANDAWGAFQDLKTNTGDNETTYTDDGSSNESNVPGLSAEDSRRYRVMAIIDRATATDLTSASSNVAAATTAEATVPGKPNAPMLDVPADGAQQIDLTWTAPTNDGGDDVTSYRIERSENANTWPAKPLVPDTADLDSPPNITGATISYSDESVPKANTRWYYRVSAINPEGVGEPSDAAFASTRPAAAPGEPTALTAWEEGPTRIVLNWKAPAATGGEITGYKIEYSDESNFADPADLVANTMSAVTTYTDNGSVAELEAGDTRYYRVSTINSADTSAAASTPASAISGTTALQPPTRLTAQNTGQRSITLSWTAPTSGATIVGYMVERSEDGSTGWEEVTAASFRTNATAITHNDEGDVVELELSTRYYYRVSTVDADRRSRPSNVANAITGGPERPGEPDLVQAGVVAQGPSRIDLTWTFAADTATGGGDITGYKIEYSDSSEEAPADVHANSWRVLVANLNKTKDEDADTPGTQITYTDGSVANLDVGDQRWYRVSAINSAGAGMPSEAIRSGAIPEEAQVPTSAPTGLTARAMGPTQINLSWTAPTDTSGDEITGYQIEYSVLDANDAWGAFQDLKTNTGDNETTYTDDGSSNESNVPGLSAEDSRRYRVMAIIDRATATDLTSASSNVAAATTAEATAPGKPNAPTLVPATAQQITVSWAAPTNDGGDDVTGYRIERSENANTWPAKALVPDTSKLEPAIPVTTTAYPDMSVPKANTRWYYRVSAINSVGTGEASDAAFAFTSPAAAPEAPMDLTAWEEGPTRIVLNWKAPAVADTGGEITGYKIEYASALATDPNAVDADTWDDLVADTMSDATTYVDDGSVAELEAGDIRYYRVSTLNSAGTSAENGAPVYSAVTGAMAPALTVDGLATASYAEDRTDVVATYTASGPGSEMVGWSTEGADYGDFSISNDGMLTFAPLPNFEMPSDADMDNVYMVTVKATSQTNTDMTAMLEVTVTVTNANDDGVVTLSPTDPSVNEEITADLVDEDNVIQGTVVWQWSKSEEMDEGYTVIDGANSAMYTPVVADIGSYLKATASYTDGLGPEQSAMATTTSKVAAADPLLVKYDRNGDGIDRGDVIAAITRYLGGDADVTRPEVIDLITLYLGS